MRIQFTQGSSIGYFPALAKPTAIDVAQLDALEADELKQLVKSANFFELPASVGSPRNGSADYTLTIEEGTLSHSVRIYVPVKDQAIQELVSAVQEQVKTVRTRSLQSPVKPPDG